MVDSFNRIELYIAYSSGDEKLYREFAPYIRGWQESGLIHSYYERKIIGEKWDHVVSEKMSTARVILLMVSPGFINTEYCYQEEVLKMMELHSRGAATVVPVLLREIDIKDTPFGRAAVLPDNGKAVVNPPWKKHQDAFDNIAEGITRVLKKIIIPTPDINRFKGKAFPYCIKQFSIKNFLCIKDLTVGELPVDAQWVFITGHNGDGKTALLQALAVGVLGNDDGSARHLIKDSPNTRIEMEFVNKGKSQIQRFFRENSHWQMDGTDPKGATPPPWFMAYGVTRLNIMTQEAEERETEEHHPVYSLYHETKGNFKNIETWFKQHPESDEMVKEVKDKLQKLMPSIEDISVRENFPEKEVIYREKGFDARYQHVSSGSKMVIAMIGDMIKRFLLSQKEAKTLADFEGIVFIDELDLHLHPIWQREFTGLLSRTFPKIQFWATTHSIVPFMKAPLNSIFLKVTRTPEKGTDIEKLEIDVKNLLPNTLISSPLFDIEDFISPYADDFRTEYLYSEILSNDDLQRELERIAKKFKLPIPSPGKKKRSK